VSEKATHNIDARSAELLARQINSAYMNACGYGIDHPMTERTCENVHQTLHAALKKDPMLSIILDRGSLFVEKHPVGARFNAKRLIDSFNEIGLESITFDTGVNEGDVLALIEVLSQLLEYPSLTAAETDLKKKQSGSIRFNHIVYRKVTSDQKVVGGDEPGEDPGQPLRDSRPVGSDTPAPGARVLNQLDSFFSLGELAADPNAAADQLTDGEGDGGEAHRAKLVEHLQKLAKEVQAGGGELEGLSHDELFSALNTLRQRVRKSVAVHADVDRLFSGSGDVVSEVDELTYSTLVTLVQEEYRGGTFSVPRIAQIINRMLPDARDLKRLLPRLRKGLMEEGMPLDDYTQLVHELSNELRGEHLVRALESGAEDVGMDVDEIVRQIEEDPTEAARLVVLASELRKGGVGDEEQLSSAFTDYIERVSQQLAISRYGHDESLDPGTLGDQLERVQKDLISEMSQAGMDADQSRALEEALKARMPELRESSKLALFDQLLASGEGLADTIVLDWLEKQIETPDELKEMSEAIAERLKAHGYSAAQAKALLDQLNKRLGVEKKPAALPGSVLSVSNTALFLKHQVKGAQRYGNPFSVIKLMVEQLAFEDGKARKPTREDMPELLPQLYTRIVRLARDLDLVGSLEKSQRAVPFIILPMTEEEGAKVFRERLEEVLKEFPFRLESRNVQLLSTITAVGYQTEEDGDANAFLKRVNQTHQDDRSAQREVASQPKGAASNGIA
jgi:hypothetical protein